MSEEIEIKAINHEKIKEAKIKKTEVYYETKNKLRLTIEQRIKPKRDEKILIYELLHLHGLEWDETEED